VKNEQLKLSQVSGRKKQKETLLVAAAKNIKKKERKASI